MIEIKSVKTESFEIEYFKFGNGKKNLVIIPGISTKSVMADADIIAEYYSGSGEDFTIWVFERKKDIQAGYDVSAMADDLAEALNISMLDNCCVLGCSQGGMIAQYLSIRHPELVKKLMLASTLARQNETSKKTFDLWYDLAKSGNAYELNRAVASRVYSSDFLTENADFLKKLDKETTSEEMRRFALLADSCRTFDAYDEIEKIKCPVLAIGSKEDAVLSFEGTVEIAQKLGCEFYIYEGYCHAVYDAAPDFRERIFKFFKD